VWDRFRTTSCAASPGMISVWGRPELSANDFVFDPYGSGWHVDRLELDRLLAATAQDAGATVCRGVRLLRCHEEFGYWRLHGVIGARTLCVNARFLIDATGRTSLIAGRLGIARIRYDHLVGVVGRIGPRETGGHRDQRALVESGPNGWWYSAPMPGRQLVAAYMTDADQVTGASTPPAKLWSQHLPSAPLTCKRVGSLSNADVDVRVVAASTVRRQRFAGTKWLAVGDAAGALDPLSGQGVAHALESGLAAARVVATVGSDREDALPEYVHSMERYFRDQLRLRAAYYRLETRWPDSAFWARRHQSLAPANV
jgi:flavin-dependent dehydrogenase